LSHKKNKVLVLTAPFHVKKYEGMAIAPYILNLALDRWVLYNIA